MIGDTPLWEIIGADSLAPVPRTYLTPACRCFLGIRLRTIQIIEPALQDLHSLFFIASLAALILALYDKPGWNMRNANCALGLVDVLTARTAGTIGVDPEVVHIDLNIHILGFRKHRNGSRTGLDPALCFRLRHTLHAVYAAFELHAGIDSLSCKAENCFLHSAALGLVYVNKLIFEAMTLRIPLVHSEQHSSEKRSLISAGPCPDLHDNISVIVLILGQKHNLQLPYLLFGFLFKLTKLTFCKLLHVPIRTGFRKHLLAFLYLTLGIRVFIILSDDGFQL